MQLIIINSPITQERVRRLAEEGFGEMVKAVVDIRKEIIALGGELHADGEALLLQQGSRQEDLWGINIYTNGKIEFSSLVNIRPSQGNRSMEIKEKETRVKIRKIVNKLIL